MRYYVIRRGLNNMLTTLARNWWMFLLRGVVAIVFGVMAIVWPDITLFTLIVLFGAFVLIDGVFSIAAAITRARQKNEWLPFLLQGLLGVGVGLGAWIWPDLTALGLMYIIAAWAILSGLAQIAAAIILRRQISNEWLLILGGVLSLVFGAIIAIFPGDGAIALVWLVGIYTVVFGVAIVIFAIRLRGLDTDSTEV